MKDVDECRGRERRNGRRMEGEEKMKEVDESRRERVGGEEEGSKDEWNVFASFISSLSAPRFPSHAHSF